MYFVTDEPILFNTETGVTYAIKPTGVTKISATKSTQMHYVYMHGGGLPLFEGSRQECEDFIYSLAGWVGAVNPVERKQCSTK